MALKHVKNKITATKKTGQVTKAMESVSAVKMRKSQERAFASRPYVRAAMRILARVSGSYEVATHPLSEVRENGLDLLIIVTSDKGLAGSVNSAVLKKAEQYFLAHDEIEVIAIGRKALEFANRARKTVVGSFTNVKDDVTVENVYEMLETALGGYNAKRYKSVSVVYQNFISTFEQAPQIRELLPLHTDVLAEIVSDIKPRTGKYSTEEIITEGSVVYTIEPSAEEVLSTLIPQLVQIMLYHALLESKASEHSARMVAMKNATDKSKEVIKALTIQYNKARQAAITAEVSEITAGVEAMK